MNGPRIAIIGATGAVGSTLLDILSQREFPTRSIRLCGSKRSSGIQIKVNGQMLEVEEPTSDLFNDVDIAFIAAGSEVSKKLAPIAVERGVLVIDKSSAFRMDPKVPLIVPEVNRNELAHNNGIIASPNCSTTPLVMILGPLNSINPVRRVIVDSYQSVSGTGKDAIEELRLQSKQILNGEPVVPKTYPHQIAFNILPQIELFLDNGYTTEEEKLVNETRKILHLPKLAVSATCVRVPVVIGHSQAVHVELTDKTTPDEVREVLSKAPGVQILDDPNSSIYPTPVDAENKDNVFVGRIRQDISHPKGIAFWIVSDNLRKGAALNSIQIAEEILSKNLLPNTTRST